MPPATLKVGRVETTLRSRVPPSAISSEFEGRQARGGAQHRRAGSTGRGRRGGRGDRRAGCSGKAAQGGRRIGLAGAVALQPDQARTREAGDGSAPGAGGCRAIGIVRHHGGEAGEATAAGIVDDPGHLLLGAEAQDVDAGCHDGGIVGEGEDADAARRGDGRHGCGRAAEQRPQQELGTCLEGLVRCLDGAFRAVAGIARDELERAVANIEQRHLGRRLEVGTELRRRARQRHQETHGGWTLRDECRGRGRGRRRQLRPPGWRLPFGAAAAGQQQGRAEGHGQETEQGATKAQHATSRLPA